MSNIEETSSNRPVSLSPHEIGRRHDDYRPKSLRKKQYGTLPSDITGTSDFSDPNDTDDVNMKEGCDSDYRSEMSAGENGGGKITPSDQVSWKVNEDAHSHEEDTTCANETSLLLSRGSNLDDSGSTSGHVSPSNSMTSNDTDSVKSDKVPFSFRNLTRDQKAIFASTNITTLLSFLSLSILAPFFPKEANEKGVDDTVAGWIFGVFSLTQFLTSPFFGKMMPVIGIRFMYLSGIFMCGGCTLLFGFTAMVSTEENADTFVALCFVIRIFLAFGCAALSTSGFVFLVRCFPNDVATVFGIGEIFTGVGMVTGPALGGFLYGIGGFLLPFAVIGISCLVALPFIWWFLPPETEVIEESKNTISMWTLLRNPKAFVNSICVIVAASIWSVLDPTLEPHLRVFNLGPEIIGVLFLIMAAVYALTSPLWGFIADRISDVRILLIPGFIMAAAGLLMLGPSQILGFSTTFNELWMNVVSLVLIGIASSLCIIPTYDFYITVLLEMGYTDDTSTLGIVSGLWVSMYAFGDFLGPSIGGFLNDYVGFEWLCSYVALGCVATSLLIAISWFIEAKCCKKKKGITLVKVEDEESNTAGERTPLIHSIRDDDDILNTYPPIHAIAKV